jgi:transposase InsO family protein
MAVSNRMKRDLAIRAFRMAIACLLHPKTASTIRIATANIVRTIIKISYASMGSKYPLSCMYTYTAGQRMGGKDNCCDNAAAENFFKTIKAELIWRRTWETRQQTLMAIIEYINGFYNPQRRHPDFGWKSPAAFERNVT